MSKLTQIERELQAIEPARFQELCDALLYARGYSAITRSGATVGSTKVAVGTPDSRFIEQDGRFVFAEYTTQQDGTYGKLLKDLKKCFDNSHSGVSPGRISEVVLCHNTKLTNEEDEKLIDECRKNGAACTILGVNAIALDLYSHYPRLAYDYLDVTLDSRQILDCDGFVRAYDASSLAPPLNTGFHFRDVEVEKALKSLETNPVLLITGRAGVGKSRFAIECARRYGSAHPDARMYAVYNRGVSLFDDVRAYFSAPGHYLIIIDDANRLPGFRDILYAVATATPHQQFRVIATVRDYAAEIAKEMAMIAGKPVVLSLESLTDQQIRELASSECGVKNHVYLDRIERIARGNARLAMMSARASMKDGFDQIHDASGIYDAYFESIRTDVGALRDDDVIAVAGIISFFRVVDHSNAEIMKLIDTHFGIAPNVFWRCVGELDRLELVDVYEDRAVRISDQVLATYLFYLTFFKTRKAPLRTLFDRLFPRFRAQLLDALRPVAETFPSDEVTTLVREQVSQLWRQLEEKQDEATLMLLLESFAALLPTRALLLVKNRIDHLQPEPTPPDSDPATRLWQRQSAPSLLAVLSGFRMLGGEDVQMAVELLCEYATKRPASLEHVQKVVVDNFGIEPYSYLQRYAKQHTVVEALRSAARNDPTGPAAGLLLGVSDAYLQIEFEQTKGNRHVLTIQRFGAPLTSELEELRRLIWSSLFELFEHAKHQQPILRLLAEHGGWGFLFTSSEMLAGEANVLLPLITTKLDPRQYTHCAAVHEYLDDLDRHQVSYDHALRQQFAHEGLAILDTFTARKLIRSGLNWTEQETGWLAGVREYVSKLDVSGFRRLFEVCVEVTGARSRNSPGFNIAAGVAEGLLAVMPNNPRVFVEALRACLKDGNRLGLGPGGLVQSLIEALGAERARELLSGEDYQAKYAWLFEFARVMPEGAIRASDVDDVLRLYEDAPPNQVPRDFGYLRRFAAFDPELPRRAALAIVRRSEAAPEVADGFEWSFSWSPSSGPPQVISDLLQQDPKLLERAYLATLAGRPSADHDGTVFNAILDASPSFAGTYIDWLVESEHAWRYLDRNYDFLWMRPDYASTMRSIVQQLYGTQDKGGHLLHRYLERFFTRELRERKSPPEVEVRQDEVLGNLIRERSTEHEFLRALFGAISDFSPERRVGHVKTLIAVNADFELFSTLELEQNGMAWSGSKVPVLRERADFWRLVRPALGSLRFLEHRKLVDERFERACVEIEWAKLEEFLDF